MTEVLEVWSWQAEAVHQVSSGLINETFIVGDGLAVLQRLNTDIFQPVVHEDIEAVTAHLARVGLPTPRLIRTGGGALWHTTDAGQCWRALTHLGDRTIDRVEVLSDAAEAGALLGRFHDATSELFWTFQNIRGEAHNTEAHFAALARAVVNHRGHRLWDRVASLADQLHEAWSSWEGPTGLPSRVIHGDPKLSNVRFQGSKALAMVDLDTLAQGTLDVELGDAVRSWCNRASEDAPEAAFDLTLFEAAMAGYASSARLLDEEWRSVVPGAERIALELAARFARDALEETYFGFNQAFGTRGDHNLLRASGQASLAESMRNARPAAERVLRGVTG